MFAAAALFLVPSLVHGQSTFTFPADAGVVDVTKPPYQATPNDDQDDTAAIQQALDDFPNGNHIIYLPNGTYLVSKTLRWGSSGRSGGEQKRTILQGQSTSGTVIKLADRSDGFTDPQKPRAVIWTGQKPAQRFRNGIRTLTVNTGKGNDGAVAIQYIANNQGTLSNVDIVSADGGGVIGLDLGYTQEIGPCLVRNVSVRGFDVGIRAKNAVNSITLEHIQLQGQRRVALSNADQVLSIRNLKTKDVPLAVENTGGAGLITLIDSDLGGAGPVAIKTSAALFARDVKTEGFASAIESIGEGKPLQIPGGPVREFSSMTPASAFASTGESLRLPIGDTPLVPQDAPDQWVGPHQFGGVADGKTDCTEAVQKAIDSGAGTTLYFPRTPKRWMVKGKVVVRGKIHRVTTLEGSIGGSGVISFADVEGNSPAFFDRADLIYSDLTIEQAATRRPLVVSGVTLGKPSLKLSAGGDVFLEDVCGNALTLLAGQNVWARQLNIENAGLHLANAGGRLWILGYKTERGGTLLETTHGGRSEILGMFAYSTGGPKREPMFVVQDEGSMLSASFGEACFNGKPFWGILSEARDGQTRQLFKGQLANRTNGSMSSLLVAAPGDNPRARPLVQVEPPAELLKLMPAKPAP